LDDGLADRIHECAFLPDLWPKVDVVVIEGDADQRLAVDAEHQALRIAAIRAAGKGVEKRLCPVPALGRRRRQL
jgi:hypothetical protein